jgi:hypothetical protein
MAWGPPAVRRWLPWALAAVAGLAIGLWWAWPSVSEDRPGVLVVDDGFLAAGRRSLELRAREDGKSVQWTPFDTRWCGDAGAFDRVVRDADPSHVVLAVGGRPACVAALAGALSGRQVVVVAEPGAASVDQPSGAGDDVVDPTRLVGGPDPDVRLVCEWWEACDGDGRIAVRDDAGMLTPAGQERVARMIVAAL